MNRLTVRGFDDALSARLSQLAEREGISLSKAALRLMRKGAGLAEIDPKPPQAYRPRPGPPLWHVDTGGI